MRKVYERVRSFAEGRWLETKRLLRDDHAGMGTVEIILIIVVLIGLVIIFKGQITELVNDIFDKITSQAAKV